MSASILKRLSGPATVSNAAATKYTTPAATKAVLRHIHANNPSGGIILFTLSVGADAAGTRLYDAYSIAAGGQLSVFVFIPLEPADIIQAFTNGAGGILVLTLSGEERPLG